jgi:hypothetical protein
VASLLTHTAATVFGFTDEHVTNLGFWGDPTKFWPSISAYPSLNKLSALQRLPHSKTHTTNINEKPTPEPVRP